MIRFYNAMVDSNEMIVFDMLMATAVNFRIKYIFSEYHLIYLYGFRP